MGGSCVFQGVWTVSQHVSSLILVISHKTVGQKGRIRTVNTLSACSHLSVDQRDADPVISVEPPTLASQSI